MLESTGQWCTRNTSTRDTDVSPSVRFCQVFPHGDSGYVPFMRISHINPILSSAHDTDLSHSVQFSSVTQSCLPLCNPRDCSTPGLPVHHQLLEFTQTQVHWVGDAIQPSHPLWNSPGQNPGVGSHSLLQGIFPTQGSNPGLPHCRWIVYQLSHQGSPTALNHSLNILLT